MSRAQDIFPVKPNMTTLPLADKKADFYRRSMKKTIIVMAALLLMFACSVLAQNAASASATADRQAAEELYQRLSGKVQDLSEAQDALRRQLDELQNQIRELRDQQNKPDSEKVERGELRKLAEQLKEVDDKRAADKELILKEISKLASMPPVVRSATTSGGDGAGQKNYEGYEHTVKSGETLIAIIRAYNKEYHLKLTVDSVIKNPMNTGLKADALTVGQKVFIPLK